MAGIDDNLRKVPPQNLEAESSVLGGILLENDAINLVLELLRPEDFYRESHRKIFRAMIELTDRNEPADLITLSEHLKARGDLDAVGGSAYLAALADFVPTAANIASYARILRDKAKVRTFINISTEIATRGFEAGDGFLSWAESKISTLLTNGQARENESSSDVELVLSSDALYGVAGDIVRTIEPFTEA